MKNFVKNRCLKTGLSDWWWIVSDVSSYRWEQHVILATRTVHHWLMLVRLARSTKYAKIPQKGKLKARSNKQHHFHHQLLPLQYPCPSRNTLRPRRSNPTYIHLQHPMNPSVRALFWWGPDSCKLSHPAIIPVSAGCRVPEMYVPSIRYTSYDLWEWWAFYKSSYNWEAITTTED